ncbi:Os05g0348433 [Oryza sativa Japonica Group]|uniref:Uncharacterized protein n=3 Tax=Oryza sativa TaxID=4530 RepID=A0A8J8XBU3_ORYSJ|nr:hypothetical protein OsI_19527 [Oryza sativa Indica Group]EEE63331.1 hypothetical protein OsJ_18142 [Oryza sativa Japonica Group]BAS93514.1 Os05g0348433 [Oryza sativa Japonica Group]
MPPATAAPDFSPGNGFAAYDHRTGGLAFRADAYSHGHGGGAASASELALLGPTGEASSRGDDGRGGAPTPATGAAAGRSFDGGG